MQEAFAFPDIPAGLVAGVDEVGRGPLAGDVVAAAVILDPQRPVAGLRDSKKLSERQRERLDREIRENALCFALARASAAEIDALNILQASLLAMSRAVSGLMKRPDFIFVDGLYCPKWDFSSAAIVKGDAKVDCIAAASIIAKVQRDQDMQRLDGHYPGYGFAKHKGYPTAEHLAALATLGPCAIHRHSYAPVRALASQDLSHGRLQ